MDDPLYPQEVELRTSVLLTPIGYSFQDYLDMAPGREEQSEHYVAVTDHPTGPKVVGTATLFISENDNGERVGKGQKKMVLSGLREYDQEKIDQLIETYNASKARHLGKA